MDLFMFTWKLISLRYYATTEFLFTAVIMVIYCAIKCIVSRCNVFLSGFSTNNPIHIYFQVSKIDDISLTMTFELYMDLMWEESRIIINETSPYWGGDGSFMGSTNFVPKMWLPDIQIYMCKQFRKRQIVTDVAGLIIFKNRKVLYTVSTEVSQQERQRKDERVNVANLPKGNTLLWFNTG